MSEARVIRLRLSLMGQPLKTYTFDKPEVVVGRDPSADIALENPGISREHLRLERLVDGTYRVVDLGSANGTQVNDRTVNVASLRENDVIRFGKYTMSVGYGHDRRHGEDAKASGAAMAQNTIVLSREELENVLAKQKQKEKEAPQEVPMTAATTRATAPTSGAASSVAAIVLAFLGGAACGCAAMWFALNR